MKDLKITVLGGLEEIGLNSTVIEVEDDIVLIDLGNNFDDDEFGVDFYLPNLDFLKGKKEKIRGLLITHGHYDHRAAIPFLIDQLGYPPVYGSPFTIELIRHHLKRDGNEKKVRLIPIHPRQEINLGKIRVKAVHLTHSIVGTYGYFLKTLAGNIFHTGDFKFDEAPFHENPSDYESLKQAGQEGVRVAMVDSTRANHDGHSQSETGISQNLEKLVKKAPGRIIVSTFAQMLSRINQIALIGRRYNRELFIKGFTLEKTTTIGKEMNILDKSLRLRDVKEMKDFADDQILLFATGSQGEERAALNKMIDAKEGILKIKPADTVILSSSTIPVNVIPIQRLIDGFADRGCRVFTDDIIDIHAGGHGHRDEIRQMIEMLKPEYVFPIEGYISFRHQLGQLASGLGYKKNKIILSKNGQTVIVKQDSYQKIGGKVKKPNVIIGSRLLPDGIEIVNQRKRAAKKGLLLISVNQKSRKIKLTSWGVPSFIVKKVKQRIGDKKAPSLEARELRKYISKLLRIDFRDDSIPEIKIDLV